MTADEVQARHDEIWNRFESEYDQMKRLEAEGSRSIYTGSTAKVQEGFSHDPVTTGISRELLQHVGGVLTSVPDGFKLHPTLAKRFMPRRVEALKNGGPFDWAFAESLAWGALLKEGYPVRLSGQDCRRGTFSQRHAVFYDYESRNRHLPLRHIDSEQAKFCVYNSLLSEAAVLGFDYGYSLGCPQMLIMWEAQFGDFANGAQVIIDQFISSAESKWQVPSSIVMLLPHGYEGMGPEHSSARLERFLQLCAEKNMIVANLSTPAQYFHALRRQKHRSFLKPLVLMTPKSLLTRPEAVSREEDFLEDECFREVLQDPQIEELNPEKVERVVFCSGKVYYDLIQYRKENELNQTAIIRVEQLYPFHGEMVGQLLEPFKRANTFVWCQEEPLNMGAWSYIWPRLDQCVGAHKVQYAGRDRASSPAAGSKAMHLREQKKLVEKAFSV